jgi:hypothetical protein
MNEENEKPDPSEAASLSKPAPRAMSAFTRRCDRDVHKSSTAKQAERAGMCLLSSKTI